MGKLLSGGQKIFSFSWGFLLSIWKCGCKEIALEFKNGHFLRQQFTLMVRNFEQRVGKMFVQLATGECIGMTLSAIRAAIFCNTRSVLMFKKILTSCMSRQSTENNVAHLQYWTIPPNVNSWIQQTIVPSISYSIRMRRLITSPYGLRRRKVTCCDFWYICYGELCIAWSQNIIKYYWRLIGNL